MAYSDTRKERAKEIDEFNESISSGSWLNEYDWLPDSWKERLKANPGAQEFIYTNSNKGLDLSVYESFLNHRGAFNKNIQDILGAYYDWLNTLPTTQVAQRRASGLNPDLNGGSDIGASESSTPSFDMPDYSLAESQQMRLSQIQYIGQLVMQCAQTALGFIGQFQQIRGQALNNETTKIYNEHYPDLLQAQIDSLKSGSDVNKVTVDKVAAETEGVKASTENTKAQTSYVSKQGKMLDVEIQSKQAQLNYMEYNEGIKAALAGQNAIQDASDSYMKGYNSVIGSEADKVAALQRYAVADQSAGLIKGYVTNTLELSDYQRWHVEAAQKIAQNQFKLDMLLQDAGMSKAEYDQAYYSSLDATKSAGRVNAENTYFSGYYGNLDAKAAAGALNAQNNLTEAVNNIKFENVKALSMYVKQLENRAFLHKDPLAMDVLFRLSLGTDFVYWAPDIVHAGTTSLMGDIYNRQFRDQYKALRGIK